MNDWTRYNCQLNLPGFDAQAQQKLSEARVLIVGAGGLGCPVAQYLVSSGVGNITLADHDIVSEKNLHRQILYTPQDIGKKKALVATEKLQQQNTFVNIIPHLARIDDRNVMNIIAAHDVVVDCTDNFETRYLLNDACVLSGRPLVYGAIYQYEGQVAVWNAKNEDSSRTPNYRDLYPEVNAAAVPNCVDGGVIPTIAGIIGCMQANEVLKLITETGEVLAGRVLIFDAQAMQSRTIKLGTITKTNITELAGSVDQISYEQVKQDIDSYTLIDVRSTEERAAFNIGGIHIPLTEINTGKIDTSKAVVCYCATGVRSRNAAKLLKKRFPAIEVYSLQGGISGLDAIQQARI